MLDIFPECNANIQTINSIVPTNGTAVLTISAETMDLTVSLEEMLRRLRAFPGVILRLLRHGHRPGTHAGL